MSRLLELDGYLVGQMDSLFSKSSVHEYDERDSMRELPCANEGLIAKLYKLYLRELKSQK